MSIRNNACFKTLLVGGALLLINPQAYACGISCQSLEFEEVHYGEISEWVGEFGDGMSDLSPINELNELKQMNPSDDNYAEVVLENSILGDVYIEQSSHFSGNKAKVVQSESNGSKAGIWQKGSSNTAIVKQEGDYNEGYIAQNGYGNDAWINQKGNGNNAYIVQYGFGNTALINQDGFNNEALIGQYGSGSSLSINQTGNNNRAYIIDYGSSNYGISQNGNDFVAIVGGYGLSISVTQN